LVIEIIEIYIKIYLASLKWIKEAKNGKDNKGDC